MKKLLAALYLLLSTVPALAQPGVIAANCVPVSRGPGVQGWATACPSASGQYLRDNGSGLAPSFGNISGFAVPMQAGSGTLATPNTAFVDTRASTGSSIHSFADNQTITATSLTGSNSFDDRTTTQGDYTATPNAQAHRYSFQSSLTFNHSGTLPIYDTFYSQYGLGASIGTITNVNAFHAAGISTANPVVTLTANTTAGSAVVTNVTPNTSGLRVGWWVQGVSQSPTGRTIQSIDSSTQITLSGNSAQTLVGTSLRFSPIGTSTGIRIENLSAGAFNKAIVAVGSTLESDHYGPFNFLSTENATTGGLGSIRVSGGAFIAKDVIAGANSTFGTFNTDTVTFKAGTTTLVNPMAINGTLTLGTPLPSGSGGTGNDGGVWPTYTPTIGCSAGAMANVTPTGAYRLIGKTLLARVVIVVVDIGTCTGFVTATLPLGLTAKDNVMWISGNHATNRSGHMQITAGSNVGNIFRYDGVINVTSGQTLEAQGTVEVN